MKKPDVVKVMAQIKDGAGDVVGKAKDTVDGFVQASKDKIVEHTAKKAAEPVPSQKKDVSKKDEPKVILDEELRKVIDQYNDAYTTLNDTGASLYNERTRAVDLIVYIESFINSIANRPKEFDTDIAEIRTQRTAFVGACEFAKEELEAAKKSALGAGAGIATGAAIVSVAPTVAMWVATTFGTASTGTAISALSGAAATNAALAWLGGGAIAAGGGGMAAGHAFLALAGPVGWGIAGVTLLSSIILFSVNKVKLNKNKKAEIEAVKTNTNTTKKTAAKIRSLLDEVVALRDGLGQQYSGCLSDYGKDFSSIPADRQLQLGTLVNNTKALAASLGKSIK